MADAQPRARGARRAPAGVSRVRPRLSYPPPARVAHPSIAPRGCRSLTARTTPPRRPLIYRSESRTRFADFFLMLRSVQVLRRGIASHHITSWVVPIWPLFSTFSLPFLYLFFTFSLPFLYLFSTFSLPFLHRRPHSVPLFPPYRPPTIPVTLSALRRHTRSVHLFSIPDTPTDSSPGAGDVSRPRGGHPRPRGPLACPRRLGCRAGGCPA